MSGSDLISGIEDEPYQGVYHGASAPKLGQEPGHLPDRFDLAEILKSKREARGWTLDEVAEVTRVRRSYLEALETAAYDLLPPRAFALGYVKAYAKALDLDEETLADMFKRDVSEQHTRLHAPSGASLEDVKPNYRAYITAGLCLVAAIAVWNVVQRRPTGARTIEQQFDAVSWTNTVPLIRGGLMVVTRPAPAPRDQDIPAPYITPGLEEGFAAIASANAAKTGAAPVQAVVTSRGFNPRGAVYGAQPEHSAVTVQVTRSSTLTLRDTAGIVHFVQTLSPGEAYRLPATDDQDLILDVSDFKAFEVYYNGEYTGLMDANRQRIGQINARASQAADALDDHQPTQAVVLTAPPPPVEAPVIIKKSDQPIPYMPAKPKPAPTVEKTAAISGSASAAAPSAPGVDHSTETPASSGQQ